MPQATHDQEAVLASMSRGKGVLLVSMSSILLSLIARFPQIRIEIEGTLLRLVLVRIEAPSVCAEDEITLIGAAIVAERLWQAAHTATKQSTASSVLTEKSEIRNGPLTDAWLSPGTPQSLPPEDHLIWQVRERHRRGVCFALH